MDLADIAPGAPRRWQSPALAVLLLGAPALAACSSGPAKEAAISKLAIGTWTCAPAATGASEMPFDLTIEDGTFSVELTDGPSPEDALTGTWGVDDGDLRIQFDGRGSDVTQMLIEQFGDLSPASTSFTLQKPGLFAPDLIDEEMTVDEMREITQSPPPLDVDVATRGTRSVTLDTAGGDPWTCDRT